MSNIAYCESFIKNLNTIKNKKKRKTSMKKVKKELPFITIYTDGACKGNPGIGGWGAIIQFKTKTQKIKGFDNKTTNNKMELTAAIKALECLNQKCKIIIYSDSQYLVKGITKWIKNWKFKNWPSSIKNQNLWKQLDKLNNKHIITWKWIKGHNNNKFNDMADNLANKAIIENTQNLVYKKRTHILRKNISNLNVA